MATQYNEELKNLRVLVVEDEYLIADEVSQALRGAGIDVVGPYGMFQEAYKAVHDTSLDCAVIDINIGGGTSFPLIDVLLCSKIPVLLMTGYDQEELPVKFRSLPLIQKPMLRGEIVEALQGLFKR